MTRTRDELAPLQNLEERRWQQVHLFTSHTKTWSYWRFESAPTCSYVVSCERPHLTWVTITHVSVPGLETWKMLKIILSKLKFIN